jgi:metallo-beta-lactamase class B
MRELKVDIFLSAHASQFDLAEKIESLRKDPGSNPFIDPEGYRRFIEGSEKAVRDRLAEQSK